jgi:hypothetical protein
MEQLNVIIFNFFRIFLIFLNFFWFIIVPLPTYFTLGHEHELDSSVIELLSSSLGDGSEPGRVAENLHFLGESGIHQIKNLRIAYLSGGFDPKAFSGVDPERQKFVTFTSDGLNGIKGRASELGFDVDIFLSAEWPRGVSSAILEPKQYVMLYYWCFSHDVFFQDFRQGKQ